VTRQAVDLSRHQRLALAGLLLEMDTPSSDPDTEAAWDEEILSRVQAVDAGLVPGVPYVEVMRRADQILPR